MRMTLRFESVGDGEFLRPSKDCSTKIVMALK